MRVYYQYGMVLGLDDFLQEQTHNLGLDYHHERALHGYGTVHGLHVTASTPPDAPDDVMLTVEPGMAIDQWGREVTVPSAQCARLGAWLAAQEEAAPGTIEANLGVSGELVIYVVAAYAECADNLVPVPGQPCSTSSQVQVPSRLRDAWDIELRWAPPAMPAWDAVRQLAGLLNSVQVVSGLDPSLSSETSLTDAVLALASPQTPSDSPSDSPSGSPPGPVTYQLPAATAGEAFDRILTVWATQVRPQLAPDLTAPDPAWDPSILLSAITFTPQLPFSTTNPVISAYSDPDDSGRPYLLHTELIQELRLGGLAGAPVVQDAVTLAATADASGVPAITAWFHLGQPVSLPAAIQVADDNGNTGAFTTNPASGTQFSQVWTLSAPSGFTVADGDQLAVTFPGTDVMVGDSATTLAAAIAGLDIPNATGAGDVTAFAPVQVTVPPPAPLASVPFVTISYVPANGGPAHLELWFHMQPSGTAEDIVMTSPSVQIWDDQVAPPGNRLYPRAFIAKPTELHTNIWMIPGNAIQSPRTKLLSLYLRVLIDTTQTQVTPVGSAGSGQQMSLGDWITTSGLNYIGLEGNNIVVFARINTVGGIAGE
jgi:hypothetical protein